MTTRKQLLEEALTEEKNVATVVTRTLAKDVKALKKAKRELEEKIEDAEDALEERLSSNVTLDKSVVEVTFSNLQDLKATLALYETFEKEILKAE